MTLTGLRRFKGWQRASLQETTETRDEGCVTNMLKDLELSTLQERHRQLRMTFLYKVVKGQVPSINIEYFLKVQRPKRTIRAKQFVDIIQKNIAENSVCNNSMCFKPIPAKTDNYRNSFFVKTVSDWNELCDSVVNAKTIDTVATELKVTPMCTLCAPHVFAIRAILEL